MSQVTNSSNASKARSRPQGGVEKLAEISAVVVCFALGILLVWPLAIHFSK